LTAERLSWDNEPAQAKVIDVPLDRELIPKRDTKASAKQIDLVDFYTGQLSEPFHVYGHMWDSELDNDLSAVPVGLTNLGGIAFDVRGVIQLRRTEPLGGPFEVVWAQYPTRVDGIPIQQEVRQLHLLLGTVAPEKEGTTVGSLVLHFADGDQAQVDLVYGQDVREWWWDPRQAAPAEAGRGRVVWTGTNPQAQFYERSLRLYVTSRENSRPGTKVISIDLVSAMSMSAPFAIALTID
jgi:hypothetical protein